MFANLTIHVAPTVVVDIMRTIFQKVFIEIPLTKKHYIPYIVNAFEWCRMSLSLVGNYIIKLGRFLGNVPYN